VCVCVCVTNGLRFIPSIVSRICVQFPHLVYLLLPGCLGVQTTRTSTLMCGSWTPTRLPGHSRSSGWCKSYCSLGAHHYAEVHLDAWALDTNMLATFHRCWLCPTKAQMCTNLDNMLSHHTALSESEEHHAKHCTHHGVYVSLARCRGIFVSRDICFKRKR